MTAGSHECAGLGAIGPRAQGGHHGALPVADGKHHRPCVEIALTQTVGGKAEPATRTGTIITLADTNVVAACDSGKGGEHV